MLTSATLKEHLDIIAATLSRHRVCVLAHRPEEWGLPTQCYENVRRKIEKDHGRDRYGWMFQYRQIADISGPGYIMAVHHAVWNSPEGHLIDVTPFHTDPKHQPLLQGGEVIFLFDEGATLVRTTNTRAPVPIRFYPLSDEQRLVAHVDRIRAEEIRRCREMSP